MASQSSSDLRFKSIQLLKGASLGAGSYGTVCKAKCDDLVCAAKILRLDAFPSKDEGLIGQECELLGAIRHPNIVQYLGTWRDPSSNLPVLLMELMDGNLTQYLENSPQSPLPFHMEVNICHDISLALAFLHSNGIIHRDLSSNNVLMIGDRRAKVTDFGMARLWDANLKNPQSSLSKRPGCEVYMSPEAYSGSYTTKLDCFSIGVLAIQILTSTFPQPGNQFKVVHISDPNFPNGIETRTPEAERRRSHINLVPPEHPLRPMALDCIKDREKDRPSSQDLCHLLAGVKETPRYTKSSSKSSADRLIEDIERQVMGLQEMSMPSISLDGDMLEEQSRHSAHNSHQHQVAMGLGRQLGTDQNHMVPPSQSQDLARHSDQEGQPVAEESHTVDTPTQEGSDEHRTTPTPEGSDEHEATPTREGSDECEATPTQEGSGEREATPTREEHEATPTHEAPMQARQIEAFQLKIQDLLGKELAANQEIERLRGSLGSMEQQLEEKQSQLQQTSGRQDPQLKEKLQRLEKGLRKKEQAISRLTSSSGPMELKRVRLDWQRETKTPRLMSRTSNSIATTDKMVYLRPGASAEIYSYNIAENVWAKFPDCPFNECGLAIIKRKLTTVGGKKEDQFSNKLLSLVETVGRKEWIVIYPPMSVKRCSVTAVHLNNQLVVAGGEGEGGGEGGGRYLKTVEVLNIDNSTWQVVADLPEPLVFASATYTGQQIFLLGGWVEKMTPTYSTFTASLDSLLQSSPAVTTTHVHTLEEEPSCTTSPWQELTKLPLKGSSCVSVNGRLLAIGGRDIHKPTSVVHIYNPITDKWEVLTHMSRCRHQCFVAAMGDSLLVIGGWELNKKQLMSETNTVEIAAVLSS